MIQWRVILTTLACWVAYTITMFVAPNLFNKRDPKK